MIHKDTYLNEELFEIKIIVIGNSGTGKTSFCSRWTKDSFNDYYRATIMTDFSYRIYEYKNKIYKILLWDIAGQDKNIQISKLFIKNAHGVIIMTDIMNNNTLEAASAWKREVDLNKCFVDGKNIPCLLIQNKIDLKNDNYDTSSIEEYASKNKYINVFQTSAKTGYNINEGMDYFIGYIIDRMSDYFLYYSTFGKEERDSINIENKEKENKEGCSC